MDVTALQADLLNRIRAAITGRASREVVLCTEWLGYLPYGLYHWIECDGKHISREFPPEWYLDWSETDLESLAKAGFLMKVDEWRNPDDEFNLKITYKVPLS